MSATGKFVHVNGAERQTVEFTGLEPATDTVASASSTTSGLSPTSPSLSTTAPLPLTGSCRVSIGAFEAVEFANKTAVTIDGGGGVDTATLSSTRPRRA